MLKKIIVIIFILALLSFGALVYLNRVFLPSKIKSMVISGLEDYTGGNVTLQALKFSFFKGLVLKDLTVSRDKNKILEAREISCVVFLPAILQKKIVIPALRIRSARLHLERRSDNTFNVQDLIPQAPSGGKKDQFGILISKIMFSSSAISFVDSSISGAFKKDIEDIDLALYLALPARVRFKFRARLAGATGTKMEAQGQYLLLDQRFVGRIAVNNLSCVEFAPYLSGLGLGISAGTVPAATAEIDFKDDILSVKLTASGQGLTVSKDEILARLNLGLSAQLKYALSGRQLSYAAEAALNDSDISGIDLLERVTGVSGLLKFSDKAISSDKLSALVWGTPIEAKINLNDLRNPVLDADITGRMDLGIVQRLIKDKFKIEIPADISGQGAFRLGLSSKLPFTGTPAISGSLDIMNGVLKFNKFNPVAENINGRLEFSANSARWPKISFKYQDLPYETSGTLTNFNAPEISFKLSSQDLFLESVLAVNKNLIDISKLEAKYLHSAFSTKGNIDISDPDNLSADLAGKLNMDLHDAIKFRAELEKARPQGAVSADFLFSGRINDPKSCDIKADILSPSVSFYGLTATDFSAVYNQIAGVADISAVNFSFYDGTARAEAKVNLESKDIAFWLNLEAQDVKIEKLKLDTVAKDKDIAGTAVARVKINGFGTDFSRINGAGEIAISEGKLWELNLFKGLGHLLFVKDFDKIMFHKGACAFIIQDKYIFTDNLKLESNIADLAGKVKIGFDGGLDAALDVRILDENVPLTGTFKDVTQAVIGTAGRFGAIKITGTLKEPKYTFQAAVVDIIKGLKDIFFGTE